MFVDSQAAEAFHDRVSECGLLIKGKRIKIGWGKSVPLPPIVSAAIQESGSRNVYIGGINSSITQERLSADFSPFGEIELINIVQDKSIAFVSFTDIISAINAIEGIKRNPSYASLKINYGKDRCANPPRIQRDMSASSWAANNYGIDRVADLLFETGISDSMFPM